MLGQAGGGKKITLDDPELQMVASGSTERRTKRGPHSHCCCEARPPRRPSTATSKPVAPIASFARREWVELAPGAEAPAGRCRGTCRTARPCPRSQPATTTYRADPRTKWPEKGRGKNPAAAPSARRSHEPNPAAAAQPQLRRVFLGPAGPNGGGMRRRADVETLKLRPRIPNLVVPAESATCEIGAFGASRRLPRRRRSRRPSGTSATMRVGSPSGATCGRTPPCSCSTHSCGRGRV